MLRISTILREKNISNSQLAQILGVTPQYVSEVVNEHRNITLEALGKFARALGVEVPQLFDGYTPAIVNATACPYCGKPIMLSKLG